MNRKNLIALACVLAVMGMTGAAFAAVPLYRLFCQVTGFDGTTMRADKASDVVLDETVLVRFDTNVRDLFAFSILYLMALFAALLVEALPGVGG